MLRLSTLRTGSPFLLAVAIVATVSLSARLYADRQQEITVAQAQMMSTLLCAVR